MPHKFLKFFVFTLVCSAVFLAGYLFTQNRNPLDQQALINNSLVSRFNEPEEKYTEPTGLFELTSGEANFPILSGNGTEVWYYVPRSGEIRSATVKNPLAGSTLVAKIQPNASNISWGANKMLLANYSTGAVYYDLGSNFSKKYETKIKNPVLDKTGVKIAYTHFNEMTGSGNVSIADSKFEVSKNIIPTRFAGWQISWLNEKMLALIKPPTLENTHISLFILDTEKKELQNILDFKNNLKVVWSPDGQKIVYSYIDPYSGQNGLYFMDLVVKKETSLNLLHNASGCTWSIDNKTVYCAGKDSFVSFDATATTIETQVVANSQNADAAYAANMFLTGTEDYLIFKNTKNGKLYGLRLN
ncbi:MAG: hypothetical protein HYX20_03960 [Candidatus Yanofskybacteria bacterium]|nr:hypothetical protein [Candidatus Yanofskybacteria bacterium]